ncbi:MAG: hypothetical protein NT069_22730 [Planctomycetota bacterium]|nr:hypothetical protein [Planctomycetota bacterium]
MSISVHYQKQRAWFCGINATWWTTLALCAVWVMVGEWNDPFTVLPAMVVLFPSAALAWAEFRVWLSPAHFLEVVARRDDRSGFSGRD